ncbi:MAG: hypothetical protein KKG47_16855 [Proteobacteria bacterium]|nr:hypothetical protein [Pseudomonadota bacterium]MBU1736515.1 hypothetical protein [Pseudomonadota bacterium]
MFKKVKKHQVGFRDCMSHDQTSWNLQPIKKKTPLGRILLRIIVWTVILYVLYAILKPYA